MRFSILTPSFNQAPFLDRNIRSVMDQDFDDVEHIVIDGGSTDGSAEILQKHDDHLAYWCSESDDGQSDALCKALDRATGDVVGWLNSDEFYRPGALSIAAAAFECDRDVMLVYGNYDRVTETGELVRHTKSWRFDYDVCRVQTPIIMNCAAFFNRQRLLDCGGFARDYHYIMDWELYTRFMDHSVKYVRLRQALAEFTVHPQSKTVTNPERFREELARMRRALFPDYSEQQIHAEYRRQYRRMKWHMLLDRALPEKIWWQLVRRRHYQRYFGPPTKHVPVLSALIDLLDPVRSDAPDAEISGQADARATYRSEE